MAHYAGTKNLSELAVKYTVTGAGVVGFPRSVIPSRAVKPTCSAQSLGAGACYWPRLGFRFADPIKRRYALFIPAAPCLALTIAMAVADVKFAVPGLDSSSCLRCMARGRGEIL